MIEAPVNHEICLFLLDPSNKNKHLTTPNLLLRLPLSTTLGPHLSTIDQHYRQYISSFMSRESMHIFGPFCQIDPDIPIYMYFDGNANRLPIFSVKYEQTIQIPEPKRKWRKMRRIVLMREGRKVDVEDQGETLGEVIDKSKIGKGSCYIGRRRVEESVKLADLEQYRSPDTNIYIRVDPC